MSSEYAHTNLRDSFPFCFNITFQFYSYTFKQSEIKATTSTHTCALHDVQVKMKSAQLHIGLLNPNTKMLNACLCLEKSTYSSLSKTLHRVFFFSVFFFFGGWGEEKKKTSNPQLISLCACHVLPGGPALYLEERSADCGRLSSSGGIPPSH